MTALVSLGSAVLDRLVDDESSRELAGGAALNVAVGTRRLGIPTTLVAAVAQDPPGAVIRELLSREGVRLVEDSAGRATTIVTSRRAAGTVEYVFSSTIPSGLLIFDATTLGLVHDAAVVVMSAMRAGDGDGPDRLVDALRRSGALRIYDPNPRVREGDDLASHRREFETIAAGCDLVKLAHEDLALFYPGGAGDVLDALFASGVRAVLTTDGPLGATLTAPGLSVHSPSAIASDDVVDPMGAGDAVTASVCASLSREGWPGDLSAWAAVLDRAMRAAAIACRRTGGATSMPREEQLA